MESVLKVHVILKFKKRSYINTDCKISVHENGGRRAAKLFSETYYLLHVLDDVNSFFTCRMLNSPETKKITAGCSTLSENAWS